jgi:hypothetical protein
LDNIKPKIALVTFTDDRDVGVSNPQVEKMLKARQENLKEFLGQNSIEVIDLLSISKDENNGWYGVRNLKDIERIVKISIDAGVEAVIIGAWTWSPPMLIMEFVRRINLCIIQKMTQCLEIFPSSAQRAQVLWSGV